jgi:hypothetical protein
MSIASAGVSARSRSSRSPSVSPSSVAALSLGDRPHDVRMRRGAGRRGFAQEGLHPAWSQHLLRLEDLHRHALARRGVLGAVDARHPALGEPLLHRVAPCDERADLRRAAATWTWRRHRERHRRAELSSLAERGVLAW